jgi:hypothetical protein
MTRQAPRLVALATNATATMSTTSTTLSDGRIHNGDYAQVSAYNANGAALCGSSAGVYAVCTTGVCTLTHSTSTNGAAWVVAIFPAREIR